MGLAVKARGAQGKLRRRFAEQRGNGMFQLRALDAQVGGLRQRGVQLRLGLRHVLVGGDAGFVEHAGQIQRILVGARRGVQELFLRVRRTQLEIIHRQFALDAQAHVFQVGQAGLRLPAHWPSRNCGRSPRNPAATRLPGAAYRTRLCRAASNPRQMTRRRPRRRGRANSSATPLRPGWPTRWENIRTTSLSFPPGQGGNSATPPPASGCWSPSPVPRARSIPVAETAPTICRGGRHLLARPFSSRRWRWPPPGVISL